MMNDFGLFRRRHLPHIDVEDKPYFVTACLDGSLSAAGLSSIRCYRNALEHRTKPHELSIPAWEILKQKLLFAFVDRLLDGDCPVRHLQDDRLAKIVQDAFLHFANDRYTLLAFVVMPSHHHWLFLPRPAWSETLMRRAKERGQIQSPREVIMHSTQSYTANACNRILGNSGPFWQGETFDHFARDAAETLRIIHYIENNPVAAGLVAEAQDWKWSSAALRARWGIPVGAPIYKPEDL